MERIPQDDVALEEINAAIKIITAGTLYDAVDIVDHQEGSQIKGVQTETSKLVNDWY